MTDKQPQPQGDEPEQDTERDEFYRLVNAFEAACGYAPPHFDVFLMARGLMDTNGRRRAQPQGDAAMGRLILEASTGMHGDIAKQLSDAWCKMAQSNEDAQSAIAARDAEIERLEAAHDTLVNRSVGAMAIAEGDDGWERVPLDCPMLVAVAALKARQPAPEAAQPADTEAQVRAVVKLVVEAQQDAYHAGMAHDGSINAQSAAFQKALQIESAIRRLVGGK